MQQARQIRRAVHARDLRLRQADEALALARLGVLPSVARSNVGTRIRSTRKIIANRTYPYTRQSAKGQCDRRTLGTKHPQ